MTHAAEWHAERPRLHQSLAHVLLNSSPLHCWHRAFGGGKEEPTDAQESGQLIHALLLGGANIHAVHERDWRKNAAKEMRASIRAAGGIPVLGWKLEEAAEIADGVRTRLERKGIRLDGLCEQVIRWDSPHGVACEGRLDHLLITDSSATIHDLKFVRSARRESCENSFIHYGYDIQHAAYVEAVETHYGLPGRVEMVYIFIESEAPHAVRIMPVGGTMRTSGQWRWARACDIWHECLERYGTDTPWPGFDDDGEAAQLPAWALSQQVAEEAAREAVV